MRYPESATTPGMPADVRSYCQSAWMLQSALPATPVGETQMAARILGVAFSRDVDVVPAAVLTPNEAEHAAALAAIETGFDAAEAAEIARRDADGNYDDRTVGRDEAKAPLAITSLHRVGGDASVSLYLFEARRTYDAPPGSGPADCDQATIMTGWLAENAAGELTLIPDTPDVSMTNCDRKGAAVVEPLGAVLADGRTFVIVVNHGYEGESYSIHDVAPAETREAVTVYGGGC